MLAGMAMGFEVTLSDYGATARRQYRGQGNNGERRGSEAQPWAKNDASTSESTTA